MHQVFVVNPKGGCGKTTIATHVAAYFASKERRVCLVDHDQQKSSSDWHSMRSTKRPAVALQSEQRIQRQEFDLVVHDFPAAFSLLDSPGIITDGDQVIIPVLPSPTDIRACLRYIMGMYRSGLLEKSIFVGVVANRVRVRSHYNDVLREFLTGLQLPLLATLRDTQHYIHALEKGNSVFDMAPSKVGKDILQWQPLLHWIAQSISQKEPELTV